MTIAVDTNGVAVDSPNTVKITLRIPEQFFEGTVDILDWDEATKDGGEFDVWELTEDWIADLDVKDELYGPDGQQVW